ncbi:S8 family serine peptidase [Candidatus Poseidonia alphae]|nr:S8 family serine peptidase [Candidatus Poseidonia alphae]
MKSQALILSLLLLLSSAPLVTGIASSQNVLVTNLESNESTEQPTVVSTYSQAVRSALSRVSDISQYSSSVLDETVSWVAIGPTPVGESLAHLNGAWLVTLSAGSGLERMLSMKEQGLVESFYPLVEQTHEPRWIPNDPKFSDQWHLVNTGQSGGTIGEDVNITGAWNTYRGNGVVIGIVDDGFDWNHPDLDDHYEPTLDYDYCGDDGDPTPASNKAHGTAAGGVAAAVGNNSLGVSGAAPMAGLAGLQLISCSTTDVREGGALSHERQSIDIYSNSWGPSDNGMTLSGPGPLMLAALEGGAQQGRGGLGSIVTWAAGNGLDDDDNANKDGYANLRYTIAVTAVTYKGEQSYYAEPGANILVAAPSNGDGESITTTDIEGSGGYTSTDYTDTFGGTSSATPLVSGVIALMLEANSNLTWRDVQHILVETSRKNDASDPSWTTNGDGHLVSHKYGFGVVDASAAVTLAEQWDSKGLEINASSGMSTVDLDIPDNSGTPLNVSFNVTDALHLESVDIYVDIDHTFRGDLEMILTAPSGMQSILSTKHEDANNNYADWRFSTVQHWGEDSRGEWILSIEDKGNGDAGTLNEWGLVLYGTERDIDSDGDMLTDANETNVYFTDPFDADSDDDQLSDGDEVFNTSTNPNSADTDGDGLDDGTEVLINGTNPLLSDTDGDGLDDGTEVLIQLTDPLERDTDGDGLDDGTEVSVNFTNPLSQDTDGDLLTDGDEVLQYFSDPLTYDPNADEDDFYWFADCNDNDAEIYPGAPERLNGLDDGCDGQWDEGFNSTDADQDTLSDFDEYHVHGTMFNLADTDGDLLRDDEELFVYFTDPLTVDNDSDGDSFYWFEDCNDTDANLNPDAQEDLDGIDNNCNGVVDETFFETDADNDLLLDYDEFTNRSTDPFNPDSDSDGLLDGEEVLETLTDPLVPDLDNDSDGYRWFLDCDDTRASVAPDQFEQWNGRDDDCDGFVDNGVDRLAHVLQTPGNRTLFINATGVPLELFVDLDLAEEDLDGLELNVRWSRNETALGTGPTLLQSSLDCNSPNSTFEKEICRSEGQTQGYQYTATVSDQYGSVNVTWTVYYQVWLPEDTGATTLIEAYSVAIGLGVIVIILLLVLVLQRRRPPEIEQISVETVQAFAGVPAAPELDTIR